MTEKCSSCGGTLGRFAHVAENAYQTVLEFAETAIIENRDGENLPDFLGEALLSGLIQGVAAAAVSMSDRNIEAVKAYLTAELETAIEIEQADQDQPQGSMVQ